MPGTTLRPAVRALLPLLLLWSALPALAEDDGKDDKSACQQPCRALVQDEEAIATDRPDFVESGDTVGTGRFQFETSVAEERTKDSQGVRTRVLSTPTLLRLGVTEDLELRLETDGMLMLRQSDPATGTTVHEHGTADIALGVKWHMQDGDEAAGKPAIAWLAHVDLDSGSGPFRGNGLRPSLRMVSEWQLSEDRCVGVMVGGAMERDDAGKRYPVGILAATFSKSWTPKARTFVELAGREIASSSNGGSVVTLDFGAAYLITKLVQVDAAVALGLNKNAPDAMFTVGLSVKF